MANVFAITTATNNVKLDNQRKGMVSFTVSNTSGRPLRGRAQVIPLAGAPAKWFKLGGEMEREFAVSGTQQYTVQIEVPPIAEAGTYLFRLDAVSVANPDDDFAEGPAVTFSVPEPEVKKKPFPWWILLVILGLVVVAGVSYAVIRSRAKPELAVAMEASPAPVIAGNELTYVVTITNTGSAKATGITISDTLSGGVSFVSSTADSCTEAGTDNVVTCNLTDPIGRDESRTVEIMMAASGAARGVVTNTVTLLHDKSDPEAAAISAGTTVTVEAQADLVVAMSGPETVQSDGDLVYKATITNNGPSQATNVVATYQAPPDILGVTAASLAANCENSDGLIACNLGVLDEGVTVPVTITVKPGPVAVGTLTGQIAVTSQETEPITSEAVSTQVSQSTGLSIVIDPSVSLALVGEPLTYTIRVWNNNTTRQARDVIMTYGLPTGADLVEITSPESDCELVTELGGTNTQSVRCEMGALEGGTDNVKFVAVQLLPTVDGTITNTVLVASTGFPQQSSTLETSVAKALSRTGLRFDGVNDWVELTDFAVPESFTVEMWINPLSTRNGQCFIGKHTADGSNLFLIGYWEGGLNVHIRDAKKTSGVPITGLHHLAVVVETINSSESGETATRVTVYRDGEPLWLDILDATVGDVTGGRPWVLGQDWDGDSTTDFFQGTMTEVRLWDHARSQAQIQANMNLRLNGDEDGLIGYWPLVERSGTVAVDHSDNGHDGQLMRGPLWVDATLPANFGSALQFNGSTSYATIPDASSIDFAREQNFTVEFWVWASPTQLYTKNSDNDVVEKWGLPPGGSYPYVIRYINQTGGDDSGKVLIARYDGINGPNARSTVKINDGRFHHIAFVKDGTILYLYIDGVLDVQAQDFTIGTTTNDSPLFLGRRGEDAPNPNFFTGIIDELRIWNVARTAAQIQGAMNRRLTGNESGLVGYWRFDEGTGNYAADLTGNGIDAVLGNEPAWVDSGAGQ